jgi:hypothetical protein
MLAALFVFHVVALFDLIIGATMVALDLLDELWM